MLAEHDANCPDGDIVWYKKKTDNKMYTASARSCLILNYQTH